jgi:antitoxin HigA-1
MIKKFRHKGLERLFRNSDAGGVLPEYVEREPRILDLLEAATAPEQLDIPGLHLHPFKGARKGEWAVTVSGNWRITFRFEGENATAVNLDGSSPMTLRHANRRPTHPGAVLREDVLPHLRMTQQEFADQLGVSRLTVSQLLHEKRGVTADMAMRLGRLLGNGPEIWLRMQQAVDIWELAQRGGYEHIKTLKAA